MLASEPKTAIYLLMFDIHDAPFVVEEFMIVEIILDQRCPTVFLCSPQLWRINKAVRHIFYGIAKEHL